MSRLAPPSARVGAGPFTLDLLEMTWRIWCLGWLPSVFICAMLTVLSGRASLASVKPGGVGLHADAVTSWYRHQVHWDTYRMWQFLSPWLNLGWNEGPYFWRIVIGVSGWALVGIIGFVFSVAVALAWQRLHPTLVGVFRSGLRRVRIVPIARGRDEAARLACRLECDEPRAMVIAGLCVLIATIAIHTLSGYWMFGSLVRILLGGALAQLAIVIGSALVAAVWTTGNRAGSALGLSGVACRRCGYDIGTGLGVRCPECGSLATSKV